MEYTTIWRFSVKAVRQGQFPHEYPSTSLVSNFQQLQSNLTWQLFLKFILFYFSPTPKTNLRFHFQWSCAQTDDLHVFLTIDWHLFILFIVHDCCSSSSSFLHGCEGSHLRFLLCRHPSVFQLLMFARDFKWHEFSLWSLFPTGKQSESSG